MELYKIYYCWITFADSYSNSFSNDIHGSDIDIPFKSDYNDFPVIKFIHSAIK